MRKALMSALIAGLFLPLVAIHAQPSTGAFEELSKQEKKKWKKIAKTYKRNPERLKVLSEEHAYYKQQSTQLQNEMEQMEAENIRLSRENSALQMEVSDLRTQVEDLEVALRERANTPPPPPEIDTDAVVMGVVFRVQIGAYSKRQISGALDTSENLELEESEAVQKVVVGQFREYEPAKELRDQLREMGVKDAWVVSYRDGIRVPIEEVLPGGGMN